MTEAKPQVLKQGGKWRSGRGFSRDELKQAGTNPKEALKLKIPIDLKRKSAHKENITTLKALLTKKATLEPKPKPKLKPKRKPKT